MPTYAYKAVQSGGAVVTGALTAENQQVALRLLDERALFPIRVEEAGVRSITGTRKRVKLRHLTVFYQQLADLLRAGVPMLRALDVLSDQKSSVALGQIVRETREDVAGGATLADAMEKHPHVFNELHCSMIRAGERGGFLEDVLARLATFAEKQDELRNRLIGAMIYPCILMFAGTVVVTFIMVFVIPKLLAHMRPETFNVLTVVVFRASDILRGYYHVILGGVLALLVGVRIAVRTEWGTRMAAMFKLKAPVLGRVVTMVAVCRFCRILGTMLHNGVPILQALKISKDSAGNVILSEQIEKAAENVRKGETLAAPLGQSGLFPADVLSMIAVAEESNNLENVLIQIADANEARTARSIDLAVRLLEPMLLMCMAVLVGIIAIALLLPILTMGSSVM